MRAFNEAENYNGLAIIIAYAHCIEQGLLTKTGPAYQKAAVESVHFPLWTYNPTTGKVKLDSAAYATLGYVGLRPRSGTSPTPSRSRRTRFRRNSYPPSGSELCAAKWLQGCENRFKQLIKKVGEEKAMAMLEKSEQGAAPCGRFAARATPSGNPTPLARAHHKENCALLKKLSEM